MAQTGLHPIVAQIGPGEEQRPAVCARGCDVAVTAGAGTGKTRTLVARYLSLLAEGRPLRSLIAITFTDKAAREMRNRVREQVRRYLGRPDLAGEEQQRWQAIYRDLDAARIGTIHSLCAEILRAHPAEAGVDPRFGVLDEGRAAALLDQAIGDTLAWAVDDPLAVTLFALLGEGGLRSLLTALLQRRLDAREALGALPADPLPAWAGALAAHQQEALAALLARTAWIAAVESLAGNAACDDDDRIEVQRAGALAGIRAAEQGELAGRLAGLARLGGINLTGGSARLWPEGRPQLDAVKAALRALRELWRAEAGVLELALNAQDEALARACPAVRACFDFAHRRYTALKFDRQALDFDDLEQGALDLLRRDEAVRAYWQRETQALLVDEFQDTNGRQRDLVRILNGAGGRLFLVGDAKQSIYRFRGADVVVFRHERQRVAREGGTVCGLTTSYRAHRGLIDALNSLLRPILGDEADERRPWVEPFAPLSPYRDEPGPGFAAPHVEVHLAVGSKAGGALDTAARAVAARIVDLVACGVQVDEDGCWRALGYGDVAVLCRASTSFGAYEDALEAAGVPFLTVAGRGFYGRPEVRDLLNALRAVADPTDDLSLVGLLRSPAVALPDMALYRLCAARNAMAPGVSLWEVLRTDATAGWPDEDRRRAARAVGLIAELNGQAGRVPVADVLKAFLDATHYRAALLSAGHSRAARNVAKLLADAHSASLAGTGEFLEYVGGLRDRGVREGEARTLAEGAVQIMSVHAAKGLEFPVVVLGDAAYGGGAGGPALLVDPDLGVVWPLKDEADRAPAVFELARVRDDSREAAETDRLLYVAATRARERLIISGTVSVRQDGTLGRPGGWLGRLLPHLAAQPAACDAEGAAAHPLDLAAAPALMTGTLYEPGWSAAVRPPAAGTPLLPEPGGLPLPGMLAPVTAAVGRLDAKAGALDQAAPQRVWQVVPLVKLGHAPAWVVGSLVHEALAAWRFPAGGPDFHPWASARAREYGVTDAHQRDDAVRHTRRLLDRFRHHALWAEMDGAERRLHEVPYSLLVDGRVESGIIDALYARAGIWTIVEFKSDRIADRAALDSLLAWDYAVQAERYLHAAEHLLGQRPRLIVCLLNYHGRVALHTLADGSPGAQ